MLHNFSSFLFILGPCSACSDVETLLSSIREDLVDAMDANVVKLESSPLERNFTSSSSAGKPLVIFFRHRVAMLYDGKSAVETQVVFLLIILS